MIASLLKTPSFTSQESGRFGVSSSTLAYFVKRGDLVRLGRGIYRGADAPEIDDYRWEDLVLANRRVKDGVICLTSALAVYGLTEELPRQHWIAIRYSTRHRASASTKTIRMRNIDLGRTSIKIGGIDVAIFDRERTIVDSFRYLGRETAIKALKAAFTKKKKSEKIDVEKLRKYSRELHVNIEPYLLAVTT